MKQLETHSYLLVEMSMTEIMEKLNSMKQLLVQYAEAHMLHNEQPLLDLEETIYHVEAIKKNLQNVDLGFYENNELPTTCKLAG